MDADGIGVEASSGAGASHPRHVTTLINSHVLSGRDIPHPLSCESLVRTVTDLFKQIGIPKPIG